MIYEKHALGLKTEVTPFTAETIAQANVIEWIDPKLELDPHLQNPKLARGKADPAYPKVGGVSGKFTGSFELRGSGTAGTAAPVISDALKAGNLIETDRTDRVDYAPDATLSVKQPATVQLFMDGKHHKGRGLQGNLKFKFKAGEAVIGTLDAEGAFVSLGDTAIIEPREDLPEADIWENADSWLLQHNAAALHEELDGALVTLRSAAATAIKFGLKVVNGSTALVVRKIALRVKKIGTPSGETYGVKVTLEPDSAGSPSGTPVTGGTSTAIPTANLSGNEEWVLFDFPDEPAISASTTYHVVPQGDYTESGTDAVQFRTDVCVEGAQATKQYDESWAALSLKNLSCMMLCALSTPAELIIEETDLDLGVKHKLYKHPNYGEGILGARHTDRGITIGLAPEECLEADRSFWNDLLEHTDLFWRATVGATAGNIWHFTAFHCAVIKAGNWANKDNIVTHPITLGLDDGANLLISNR